MKKSLGAQDPRFPDTNLDCWDVRQGRPAQRDGRRLGWHLLFRSTLHCGLVAQGNLHLRQPDGTKGIHRQRAIGKPRQGSRLLRAG